MAVTALDTTDGAQFPAFDAGSLPSFFPAESQRARNVAITLADERRLARRAAKRTFLDATHVANAAKHLERLPEAGESIHCVMRGNYNAWDLVPAVLKLAGPSTCQSLHISTLGFNGIVIDELLGLLDAGTVGEVAFLASCYFKSTTGDLFDRLHAGLTERGQRIAAARSHAKVVLFALDDGRRLVIESSANLRSCRNIEAFTLTSCPELYDFHRAWLTEVIAGANHG